MQGSFSNILISAVVGCLSAVGTSWYLSANPQTPSGGPAPAPAASGTAQAPAPEPADKLDVTELVVRGSVLLVDPETNEATLEIKNGSIFAKQGIYAKRVGAYRVSSQKLIATPDNPLAPDCAVYGQLAVDQYGGAFMELLSPRESHSITFGFDRNEKGCVVSRNNDDASLVAQAIFPKPRAEDAGVKEPDNAPAETQADPPAQTAASGSAEVAAAAKPASDPVAEAGIPIPGKVAAAEPDVRQN